MKASAPANPVLDLSAYELLALGKALIYGILVSNAADVRCYPPSEGDPRACLLTDPRIEGPPSQKCQRHRPELLEQPRDAGACESLA